MVVVTEENFEITQSYNEVIHEQNGEQFLAQFEPQCQVSTEKPRPILIIKPALAN